MTLKDVTQLVRARLNKHEWKYELTFKWRDFLRYGACDVTEGGTLI